MPRRSWRARDVLIAGVVAVAVVIAVLVVATRGVGDDPGSDDAVPAGVTGPDFHSLVADPTTPGRLFVGGHETVSESTDGGLTWRQVPSLDDADAMGWGFTADAVFVSGHPGLNRSTDGAATFAQMNNGLPGTDVHAFGAERSVLYGAAVDGGFFASVDDGDTWQVRSTAGTQGFFGRIVVDPADDEHLFVAAGQSGVAESSDGGRTWRAVDTGLGGASWVSRSANSLDVLVASGPAGAARSSDGGRTWSPMEVPDGVSLVEVSTADPQVLYAGAHSGIAVRLHVSGDGGTTWTAP